MKIKEAANEITNSKNWVVNFSIYTLIVMATGIVGFFIKDFKHSEIAMILVATILILITDFLIFGYNITTLRNYMLKKNPFLPGWAANIKEICKISLKASSGMLLYGVSFLILLSLIPLLIPMLVRSSVFSIVIVIYSLILIIAFLAFTYMMPAIMIYFCTNLKTKSCFNIKQANNIIEQDRKNYTKVFVKASSLTFLTGFLATLFSEVIILNVVFNVITAFATILSSVLYGNYFRTILEDHKRAQPNY